MSKEIRVYNKKEIYLEGFGFIEVSETNDDAWNVDIFPRGTENEKKNLRICLDDAHKDKTFSYVSHLQSLTNQT